VRALAAGAIVLIALSACTPAGGTPTPTATSTPSPTPTPEVSLPVPTVKPAVSDLVIGPDGIGPLRIGSPPPSYGSDLDILVFDPAYCQAAFDQGYVSDPGLWVANYPDEVPGVESRPFGVWLNEDGGVEEIAVYRPGVHTERGIQVGSTPAEVLAAYPEGFSRTDPAGEHYFYVIESATGQLQIEIVDAEPFPNAVFSLISTRLSTEAYGAYATDVELGRCVNG
jgi:hypothetical protein